MRQHYLRVLTEQLNAFYLRQIAAPANYSQMEDAKLCFFSKQQDAKRAVDVEELSEDVKARLENFTIRLEV